MIFFKRTFFYLLTISVFIACNNEQPKPEPVAADDTPVVINNKQVRRPEDRVNAYAEVDVSPMDMSYYPPKYPQLKMSDPSMEPPVMRVIYSRPHLQGRKLFPDILKYGEPWRLGANEATELQVFKTVTVGAHKLSPGRYTLHCIPAETEWAIIFNSAVDVWGLKFDEKKDLFRINIPVTHENISIEYFTAVFEKADGGANLVMHWGDLVAKLPFRF